MLTESNLFYVPPTLTERIATHDVYVGPAAATFDEASDILLEVAPSTDLIFLADMRFECELHVFDRNDNALDPAENVCPVNNILESLFQCVVVELAGRSISDPSNLYFIRSYFARLHIDFYEESVLRGRICARLFTGQNQLDWDLCTWYASHGNSNRRSSCQ